MRAKRTANSTILAARDPKGGRPSQDIASRLGEHILEIAIACFIEHGAQGASMDGIAAAANVSKRTLYARYGSKMGLLVASIKFSLKDRLNPVNAAAHPGSPREKLIAAASTMLDLSLEPENIGIENLIYWVREQEIEDFDAQDLLVNSTTAFVHSLLREAGGQELGNPSELRFLASFILDTLVTIPRQRILIRKDMPNTPGAKANYLEQALDILAGRLPFLRSAAIKGGQAVS